MLSDSDLSPQALDRATALPASCYVDADGMALDRREVFARSWQLVAHASRLSTAGDHVVAEIAGVPLVVVRSTDGVLRALHNVCRHRAGPLATCDGRGARNLTCRYHGWTYGLDGQLLRAPDMHGASGFDPASIRLPEARIGEWQGLVFAALDDVVPLAQVLDGIERRLGAIRLSDYAFEQRVDYDIACNWKVYVDNFLEGYHLPLVHPELNRLLDYRSYTTETGAWHSLQSSPIDDTDGPYGKGEALYFFLWPNVMLNILPGRMQVNRVIPLEAGRCRVQFDYCYAPGERGAANTAALRDEDRTFSDLVQRQDIAICERVQCGLASGSYRAGRLNPRRENGVHHFHELLRAAYRARDRAHRPSRRESK
ncbi:MAG TPA: aromatic ring-hydroxylating dioxygenase subunit alpha [Rhodanobacteraceae bacterium]|nr:aromatic ring-hydroxylating dioxygenase subunit alpha [Rhodanobacteraceae bacterium]